MKICINQGGVGKQASPCFSEEQLGLDSPLTSPIFLEITAASWMAHNHHLLTHSNAQPEPVTPSCTALTRRVCSPNTLSPQTPGCITQGRQQPAPARSHGRTHTGLPQTNTKSVCCHVHSKDFKFLEGKGIPVHKINNFIGL